MSTQTMEQPRPGTVPRGVVQGERPAEVRLPQTREVEPEPDERPGERLNRLAEGIGRIQPTAEAPKPRKLPKPPKPRKPKRELLRRIYERRSEGFD